MRFLAIIVLSLQASIAAAAPPPKLFFSDLDSGPNSGGENDAGVYVTLWGENFGAARRGARVTVGGGEAAKYLLWSDSQIVVQLGAAAQSGDIVVDTRDGASNGIPFRVRPGNIYFLDRHASEGGRGTSPPASATAANCSAYPTLGTMDAPWAFTSVWTPSAYANLCLKPGDTLYFLDGVSSNALNGTRGYLRENATIRLTTSGSSELPKALVAYPGALVRFGDYQNEYTLTSAIRPGANRIKHWTISKLNLYGSMALATAAYASDWRIIGNTFRCPTGDGPAACVDFAQTARVRFLGNEITEAGCSEDTTVCPMGLATPSGTIASSDGGRTWVSQYTFVPSGFKAKQTRVEINNDGVVRLVTEIVASRPFTFQVEPPVGTDATAAAWKYRHYQSSKLYHAFYATTDSTAVEFAWNEVHDNKSCRAIQFHSSPIGTISGITDPPAPDTPASCGEGNGGAETCVDPGGSYQARTLFVTLRYVNTQAVPAEITRSSGQKEVYLEPGQILRVNSPTPGKHIAPDGKERIVTGGYNVYISTTAGQIGTRQNAAPIPIGSSWTQPENGDPQTSLVAGANPATASGVITGFGQYDISIHDNVIYNQVCDGINLATVDPSQGKVEVYNNVIHHVGIGPDPPDGSAHYSCIYVAGATNNGPNGSGPVDIYNNTLHACGTKGPSAAAFGRGSVASDLYLNLNNNLVYQTSDVPYFTLTSPTSWGITGARNLWFSEGSSRPAPSAVSENIEADPLLVDPENGNYSLRPNSPALQNNTTEGEGRRSAEGARKVGAFGLVVPTIRNAASMLNGPVAPGQQVAIYHPAINADGVRHGVVNEGKLSADGLGVRVLFDEVAAPLLSVSPNKVKALVPARLREGEAVNVVLDVDGTRYDAGTILVARSAPAIFTAAGNKKQAAALNEDNTPNSPENPAAAGSVISVFVTGDGEIDAARPDGLIITDVLPNVTAPVTAELAHSPAEVVWAALAPGTVGVAQIQLRLPANLPASSRTRLRLRVGNAYTQWVHVAVR